MRILPTMALAAAALAAGLATPAQATPSDFQLRTAGDRTSPWCGTYMGSNELGRRGGDTFHVYQCFQTKSACDRWYYQVQTKYPRARVRRPCARVN